MLCIVFSIKWCSHNLAYLSRLYVLIMGGEYFKNELTDFPHSVGTIHQTSCSQSSQHNGVAERKNMHLLEVIRSLLLRGHDPSHL